jgi:hypothetical protein
LEAICGLKLKKYIVGYFPMKKTQFFVFHRPFPERGCKKPPDTPTLVCALLLCGNTRTRCQPPGKGRQNPL